MQPFHLYISKLGDFNGHLFCSGQPSQEDVKLGELDNALKSSGLLRFPSTERPFTYRSGKHLTTIDYMFARSVDVTEFAVARLVLEKVVEQSHDSSSHVQYF